MKLATTAATSRVSVERILQVIDVAKVHVAEAGAALDKFASDGVSVNSSAIKSRAIRIVPNTIHATAGGARSSFEAAMLVKRDVLREALHNADVSFPEREGINAALKQVDAGYEELRGFLVRAEASSLIVRKSFPDGLPWEGRIKSLGKGGLSAHVPRVSERRMLFDNGNFRPNPMWTSDFHPSARATKALDQLAATLKEAAAQPKIISKDMDSTVRAQLAAIDPALAATVDDIVDGVITTSKGA